MSPVFASNNITHVPRAQSVLLGNGGGIRLWNCPNSQHILLGQSGIPMFYALLASRLLGHISGIISVSAQKEMRRISTARIITMVADQITIWKDAVVQQIRKSVGKHIAAVQRKHTVPVWQLWPQPIPALLWGRRLDNLFPKSRSLSWSNRQVSAGPSITGYLCATRSTGMAAPMLTVLLYRKVRQGQFRVTLNADL